MSNKYLLFAWFISDSYGGFNDFKGCFSSVKEALAVYKESYSTYEWCQVVRDDKKYRKWQWKKEDVPEPKNFIESKGDLS